MSPAGRTCFQRLILWAAPLVVLACGGEGGTDVVLPALRITTATSGVELDPDGYSVAIDGQAPQPIGANATLITEDLPAGQHTVELSGIADNCTVGGENPQPVSVVAGSTATVAFVITCSPLAGLVQVVTTTTGSDIDPDGFALLFDGTDRGPIGANATSSVTDATPGTHTIGLTGIAANCQISGENPRAIEVGAGGTAQVAFALACTAVGATTGSIQVATTTTGAGTDPDGFALLFDGADQGPIGLNATSSVAGLPAGSHTIGLTGVAGNCQVAGDNPRPVTVPAGGTAQVAFAITCSVPGPETGTVRVVTATTGAGTDPDGFSLLLDGTAHGPIGLNATSSLAGLTAGSHTIGLTGIAANCQVSGENPLGVAVQAGETARVSFAVTCAATVGALRVTVEGLPGGVAAAVTVAGPNDFSQQVTATRTLSDLVPGSYAVSAEQVEGGGNTYTSSVSRPTVPVVAGATATVTVSYTAVVVAPTLNLRIDGLYLTQSTQTYTSSVPLVADRAGYLRVFVVANEANTARPTVRVRLSSGGSTETLNLPAPGSQTPLQVQEGTLGSSWNIPIPASLIRPGLTVVAELDPGNDIQESNESDNRFPASNSKALVVQSVPAAGIRFVSVQQGTSAPGNVSNTNQLMTHARRLHPLNDIDVDVRSEVFTASAPLLPGTAGDGWGQLVSDLDGLRVLEGTNRTYFGIVKLDYGRNDGLVGAAFQEIPTAAGWDDPADASRVVAHELGHTWGRRHSPCGDPPASTVDGLYPYSGGQIGVFGMDVQAAALKQPSSPDIMSYCFQNFWISDYTYRGIMDFRQRSSVVASAVPQPSLLIWGRVVDGRPILEPAFEVVTRPSLPSRPGPYTVSATAADGSRLFNLSFDVAEADGLSGHGHFAFAVPLDPARASRLVTMRLDGPTGTASLQTLAQLRAGPVSETIVARREGENVSLRWNAAAHPMIVVRDPDTGEVLSFARGGTALVRTDKGELDLDVSDGVRSQRVRLAISRS